MGCGASIEAPPSGGGGGGGGDGNAELFSDESHAMLSVKIRGGRETFDAYVADDKTGSSRNIAKAWGLSKSCPIEMRYWKDNEFPQISTVDTKPYGDISLGDSDSLTILLGTHMPIAAPVAKFKALGSVAVICPVVYTVDLHITVDGESITDGHVCCGDATLDKAASIKHAIDKVVDAGHEDQVQSLLENGPPGPKPWATLVAKSFKSQAFVHLPLIWQGNLDDATVPESEEYGGALLARFSELLAKVGPGKHDWELRIAPRGVIAGGEYCEGVGGFKGGGTSGTGLGMEDYYEDPGFKEFIDGKLNGQHIAADIPALTAMFNLELPEKLCKGGGAERQAPEFNTSFAEDIEEHCNLAYKLATTGPARGAVSKVLEGSVGNAAHIIIPPSDLAGGITPMASQGGKEGGTRYFATALFFGTDPEDEDGLGAMVKFVCAKYKRRNFKDVDDPQWECEGTFGNGRDKCAAFPIKNKQIKAAIARDATVWSVASAE
jgi:hypothetical protein